MLKDQSELQAEIDALDRHMANLNNQNYSLQKELEEFVHADDAVRMNLDRKLKVENIRTRVDDVIARSQIEVSRAGMAHPALIERPMRTFSHDFGPVEKVPRRGVTSYSPMRQERQEHIIERRQPFREFNGGENVDLRRQYSFGRETLGQRSSPLRDAFKQDMMRSKSGGKNVTFQEYPRF